MLRHIATTVTLLSAGAAEKDGAFEIRVELRRLLAYFGLN